MPEHRTNQRAVRRPASTVPASEDVLIRNHDFQWGYDLELTVEHADGETVFEDRYYLQPGGSRSEFDALGRGEYVVHAELDNRRTVTTRVSIEAGAGGGVLIELGNGALSVHSGLYG
jgi:hypothetical protein